ncbi:MAG: GIY-YIG nuclease family protein [Proteobacteria bacterium]|nr:GIY-YIG nuclease family protein [Pseudomonadota bacterium]
MYYVYILFSKKRGTTYVGVTRDLVKRVYEHKNKVVEGFSKKYGIDKLGHYEVFEDVRNAIEREKELKKWHRQWKIDLIEKENPDWDDLYEQVCK